MPVFPCRWNVEMPTCVVDLKRDRPNNSLMGKALLDDGRRRIFRGVIRAGRWVMFALGSLWPSGRKKCPWREHYPLDVPFHLDYPKEPLGWLLEDAAQRFP